MNLIRPVSPWQPSLQVKTLSNAELFWVGNHCCIQTGDQVSVIVDPHSASALQGKPALKPQGHQVLNLDSGFPLFLYPNAGHGFSGLLSLARVFWTNNLAQQCVVVLPQRLLNVNAFITSLIKMLFNGAQLLLVTDAKICCKTLFLAETMWSIEHLTGSPGTEVVVDQARSIKQYQFDLLSSIPENTTLAWAKTRFANVCPLPLLPQGRNVAVLKIAGAGQQGSPIRAFGSSYETLFKNLGFETISVPEALTFEEIYEKIHNAPLVVLSWGCSGYIQRCFVNPNSKVLMLAETGYTCETRTDMEAYNQKGPDKLAILYGVVCSQMRFITNLPPHVDKEITALLVKHVKDLTGE